MTIAAPVSARRGETPISTLDFPLALTRLAEAGDERWRYHVTLNGQRVENCHSADAGTGIVCVLRPVTRRGADGEEHATGLYVANDQPDSERFLCLPPGAVTITRHTPPPGSLPTDGTTREVVKATLEAQEQPVSSLFGTKDAPKTPPPTGGLALEWGE